jgi:SAM-dependent methyltransferase
MRAHSEPRFDLQLGLVSLAVVDDAWRARELAEPPSRAAFFAEAMAAHHQSAAANAVTSSEPSGYLASVRGAWEQFGRSDPLYYILTSESKKGNRWDPDDFFAHGRRNIDAALDAIDSLGASTPRRRALDFGCGVGRLTQALARHFDEVHGVDIARSMIDGADRVNSFPDRAFYHQVDAGHLGLFPADSFDFVYTDIVLQHMRPQFAARYLAEFLRILAPGGVLLFQLPSHPPLSPRGLLLRCLPEQARMRYLRRTWILPEQMEFHWMPRKAVVRALEQSGGVVRAVLPDQSAAGPTISYRYCVTKAGTPGARELAAIPVGRRDAAHEGGARSHAARAENGRDVGRPRSL